MTPLLTPQVLVSAYANGIFPMAEHRTDTDVFWVDPRKRGVLPLDGFHISRSLRKTLRSQKFLVTFNEDFQGVVAGCADRAETWINDMLVSLYSQLHSDQLAHSIEVWEEDTLVGGVFGIALGGAFFGESMFSTRTDASKVALACLVDRLNAGGFTLFDTQFITPHLASLGGIEITRASYRQMLKKALDEKAVFIAAPEGADGQSLLQRNAQTS